MRIRLLRRRQRPSPQEARLRPEYSLQYPRIKPDVWLPPRTVFRRNRKYGSQGASRLPDDAFEFRGGVPRNAGWPLLRQRATDTLPE